MGVFGIMFPDCKKRGKITPAIKTQLFIKEKKLQMENEIKLEDLSQTLLLTHLTPD